MITGMSEGDSVERHRAVGAIRGELSVKHSASTERLRAVFEELDVGMILKDAEGKPLETNPALRSVKTPSRTATGLIQEADSCERQAFPT